MWCVFGSSGGDSVADRLHRKYTVIFLLVAAIVTATQLPKTSQPIIETNIECWPPSQFTPQQYAYVTNLCAKRKTFYLPTDPTKPADPQTMITIEPPRPASENSIERWVAVFLLLQALCFLAPYVIWKWMDSRCGIGLTTFAYEHLAGESDRERFGRYVGKHMSNFIKSTLKGSRTVKLPFCGCVSIMYMIYKLLLMVNIIGQFIFLARISELSEHSEKPFDILTRILSGGEIPNTGLNTTEALSDVTMDNEQVPEQVICDLAIARLGNVNQHRATIPCTISFGLRTVPNHYREFLTKILTVVWIWYLVIGLLTAGSITTWAWRILDTRHQSRYMRDYVAAGSGKEIEDEAAKAFVGTFLCRDGYLILAMFSDNVGCMPCGGAVSELYDGYLNSNIELHVPDPDKNALV